MSSNPFEPLITRMRAVEFLTADQGDERVTIKPPATAKHLEQLRRRFRVDVLPESLTQFLSVTLGFAGTSPTFGSAELSFDPKLSVCTASPRGLAGMWSAGVDHYDDDMMLIDLDDDDCRVWHLSLLDDDFRLTLIAHTLEGYVSRCADYYEAIRANEDAEEAGEEEEEEEGTEEAVEPINPRDAQFVDEPFTVAAYADLIDEDDTPEFVSFVKGLPANAVVFDWRGDENRPIETKLPSGFDLRLQPGFMKRMGAIVALIPGIKGPKVKTQDDDPAMPFLDRIFAFHSMELWDEAEKALSEGLAAAPDHPSLLEWQRRLLARKDVKPG